MIDRFVELKEGPAQGNGPAQGGSQTRQPIVRRWVDTLLRCPGARWVTCVHSTCRAWSFTDYPPALQCSTARGTSKEVKVSKRLKLPRECELRGSKVRVALTQPVLRDLGRRRSLNRRVAVTHCHEDPKRKGPSSRADKHRPRRNTELLVGGGCMIVQQRHVLPRSLGFRQCSVHRTSLYSAALTHNEAEQIVDPLESLDMRPSTLPRRWLVAENRSLTTVIETSWAWPRLVGEALSALRVPSSSPETRFTVAAPVELVPDTRQCRCSCQDLSPRPMLPLAVTPLSQCSLTG